MIFVSGATGNVGSELVAALADKGEPVRALTRTPKTSQKPGVEQVAGDLNQPDTLVDALAGVRGAFLLPGYADMPGLLNRIRRAGVERVVLLSGSSVDSRDTDNAISRYMIESEQAVRESGVAWTILRPRAFMSNALRWLPQLAEGDVVSVPFAGVRTAAVDPADIAAVAVRALLDDGHAERVYPVTGPESLLPADQIAVLAGVLGRDLRCVALSDAEARAEMEATTPVEYVDAFFSFYVDGNLDESEVLPTVHEVTGRPPRTFTRWAETHTAAFS